MYRLGDCLAGGQAFGFGFGDQRKFEIAIDKRTDQNLVFGSLVRHGSVIHLQPHNASVAWSRSERVDTCWITDDLPETKSA
jgi:hypothetical protein